MDLPPPELFPDGGSAWFAKPDPSGIHRFRAVHRGVANHQAIDFLLVVVMVETERVSKFVQCDLGKALGKHALRRLVIGERMDAGGCSGQAEIGVSEEKVVAGGRDRDARS